MESYNYNRIHNILEIKKEGNKNINDIVDHYKKISNDDSLPSKLKVLIDYSDTNFDIKLEEIELAIKSLKSALEKFEIITEAVITSTPFPADVVTLFEKYSELNNYSTRTFTIKKSGINWLL